MKLADYIASKINQPFEYGVNDCVIFAIGWIDIKTGGGYMPAVTWTNEREALAALKKVGGLIEAFDKKLQRIEPNFARDGDVTVCDGVASLFLGANIVAVSKDGLIYKSRLEAKNAWTL